MKKLISTVSILAASFNLAIVAQAETTLQGHAGTFVEGPTFWSAYCGSVISILVILGKVRPGSQCNEGYSCTRLAPEHQTLRYSRVDCKNFKLSQHLNRTWLDISRLT